MIHVENLTKKYGDFLAVDDISFTIKSKEVVGLLGLNGAGKTTTFYMVVGFIKPNEGRVFLDEKDIKTRKFIYFKYFSYFLYF